jgi:hypothetical protein
MRNELSVEIDRPIAEVFEFTLKNVVEWVEIVVEDELVEDKDNGGVGTTFRVVTEESGRRMVFDGVVTRHEPPTASSVIMKGPSFDIEAEYTFEDLSGRTRVTQVSTFRGRGFTGVMMFLLGWMMKGAGRKALGKDFERLKKLLEAPASAAD